MQSTGKNIKIKTKDFALREMIQSENTRFLMEAHNGLSAKIAEEAGFEGIWASGLSISAQLGVRDSNEASWTQVLEVIEFMSDATKIPILLDGDTGYGNFNSMRRLVRKLESRDIAGVCIEDKLFPKTNSFINGSGQPLAEIDEFCGKIKAGKDAQNSEHFNIVARVEAFIAGWGLKEAIKRAEAYRKAGADAILIHSALRNPGEILEFKKEWGNRLPVVIVPTKYYTTPTDVFKDHGFSIVIWANHLMRSAVTAMQQTAKQIFEDQNLLAVEENIATVNEIFRLQGAPELSEAEKLYLPTNEAQCSAIVLAASRGEALGELTKHMPKAMVDIAGKPLIAHIADTYREAGIKELCVVRGYKKDALNLTGINYVDNDAYSSTGELASLWAAREKLTGTTIISYGDVLFKKYLLQEMLDLDGDFIVIADAVWQTSRNAGRLTDFVTCSEPKSKKSFYNKVTLKEMHSDAGRNDIHGEWIGILKISEKGAQIISELLEKLVKTDKKSFDAMKIPDLISLLVKAGNDIRVIYTAGSWLDVDTIDDVLAGSSF